MSGETPQDNGIGSILFTGGAICCQTDTGGGLGIKVLELHEKTNT